jgi:Leucine-rich repeat (LRR) protein
MANLVELDLAGNQISDDGVTALAKAITPASKGGSGALPQLTSLFLDTNNIGDAGCSALASAVGSNALASLKTLHVDDGPLGTEHPALKAACTARGISLP